MVYSQYAEENQQRFTRKQGVPMSPMRLKVGCVGVLSCLALMLGLFSSTGVASAHSTQALQSQASASTLANDRNQAQCRTFYTVNQRFRGFEDQNTGQFISNIPVVSFQGHSGVFVPGRQGRQFHQVSSRLFERETIVTTCNGHRSQRTVIRGI